MAEARRKDRKMLRTVVLLLLVALCLQGCSGGGSGGTSGGASQGGTVSDSSMSRAGGGVEMASVGQPDGGADAGEGFDRMIVKTADLGLRADDVRESAAGARRVADRAGGEVLSSRVYGGSDPDYADLVFSVPSGEFEATLEELRGLGRQVTNDSVKGQDVTEEFVDLESRERNLLAAEESLLKLYDRAESVEDTLDVQGELTNVRGQIEEVQGRIQYLEQRTASSQISLSIEPVAGATPQQAWDPALVATRAWDASLRVLQAGATAAISAVVFCWWLAPALVIGLVWWRRTRAPRPADPSG